MSARPWYRRYGGDFVMGTMALSLEEKGAYSLCLDLIYDRGGPIPDDARWLAGVCGVSVRKWMALRESLIAAGKILARDGCLTNSRAEIEIENALKIARKVAENGAKGGNKRTENASRQRDNNDLGQARLKPTRGLPLPEPEKKETQANACVARSDWPSDFADRFWAAFPNKVGKADALKSLDKVRRSGAVPFERLMAALARYVRTKPPDRHWCHPSTWLNGGRWDDEPAEEPLALNGYRNDPRNDRSVIAAADRLDKRLRGLSPGEDLLGERPTLLTAYVGGRG